MTDITTQSFDGLVVPHEVTASIINTGLSGAPVFSTFTRRTTASNAVVFPTADPDGFDWVAQLGPIPDVDPHDSAVVVSPAKLGGLLLLSNESIADSAFPIADEVGRLIRDSMAPKADRDILYGDGTNPAAPPALIDALDTATGPTLRAAVVDAAAAIMSNGGTPTHVILSPALWAAEMERREDTPHATGPLLADLGLNLTVSVAATLHDEDALVIDKTGCFGIVRKDYTIEASRETTQAWTHDGVSLRVLARLAATIPSPAKHARALAVNTSA